MKRSKPLKNQMNFKVKRSQPEIGVNGKEKTQETVISLNIKLIIQNENKNFIEEMIEQLPINNFLSNNKISSQRTLILAKLIQQLKTVMDFPLQSNFIFFYLDMAQMFMKCGKDPISPDIKIRPQHFKNKHSIIIKAISKGSKRSCQLMRPQNSNENLISLKDQRKNQQNKIEKENSTEIKVQKVKRGHGQERKIGHIIDSVQEWLRIYNESKISLKNAAKEVKIPKKTLDGYLIQLKMGHYFKFNFTQHAEEKIGLLRDFVKKKNEEEKLREQNKIKRKLKKQQQKYLDKFIQ